MKKQHLLPFIFIVVAIIVGSSLFYLKKGGKEKGIMSAQEASQKALNYINKNFIQGDTKASLIDIKEENGVYKFQIKVGEQTFESYVTKNGKLLFPQAIDLDSIPSLSQEPGNQERREMALTIGNFSVSGDEVCLEEGKPIIYFFGSKSCPHCRWEHPIFEGVAKIFEDYVSFHNNMDSQAADSDVFSKYSPGGIPTIVLGCRYYRVGSGEQLGAEKELEVLTALICKLTESQPADTCSKVQTLIDQIKD